MKVRIDDELFDGLIVARLKKDMKGIRKDIKNLTAKTHLQPYEFEDLANFTLTLRGMEEVYTYYGGGL
jgi:hypothetical protein